MAITQHLVMVRSASRLVRRPVSRVIIKESIVFPQPIPTPFKRGMFFTLVQRDPTQEQPLRRFTEIVADMLNSLVGQGQIIQTGPASWSIVPGTVGGLTGTFTSGTH